MKLASKKFQYGQEFGLALIFNFLFYIYLRGHFQTFGGSFFLNEIDPEARAKTLALEFLTGFVVEKSLAIDNIFVFAVVFSYFGNSGKYQHRVLFWGILSVFVFRAIFIAMGSILMQYQWIIIIFGALLILTGIKVFFAGTKAQNFENNFIVKHLKKIFRVHSQIEGEKFFFRKN